jgi:hypothetical protein
MKRIFGLSLVLLLLAAIITPAFAADNELTEQEQEDGWILLFNGENYDGWICNNGEEVASDIDDGCMQPYKSGGYIVIHEKKFGDFILKCDVKMPEGCNSGIFLRIEEPTNPVHTGYEIQVMTGEGTSCHDFGAIYDLVPLTENVSNGPGKWNSFEITCRGPLMSVKANGKVVCEMDADEFDEPGERAIEGSHKYKLDGVSRAVADFAREGYLGFQDHGHPVWYKNVRILPLEEEAEE